MNPTKDLHGDILVGVVPFGNVLSICFKCKKNPDRRKKLVDSKQIEAVQALHV